MTAYQWVTLALGTLGFLFTWTLGWFGAGRFVEKVKAALREDIDAESEARRKALDALREYFDDSQKSQEHNFGEVGAAMRQYIADVEKQVRENEIWGRDHFVKKEDFKQIMAQFREDLKDAVAEIKKDMREIITRQ